MKVIKMLSKKAIILPLVLSLLISVVPANSVKAAELGTLSYWYSDSDTIRRWGTIPSSIYSKKLNSTASFYYLIGLDHGISQWNSALSKSMSRGTSTSTLSFYGGTKAELDALGTFSLSTTNTGLTLITSSSEGTWKYGTTSKTGRKISKAVGCVVDKGRTSDQYKKTATHEFAHALGWAGHSSESTDIMYATSSSITTLTTRDKRHLTQVY